MLDHPSVQGILAANLRRLRIARRLSLSELARTTRMSKATLSGIENERANPTVETLAGLAGALGVSIAELLEQLPLGDVRIVRAAQSEIVEHDGIPMRMIDELDVDGALQLAELELPARHAREIEPGPPGSRAHLIVLAGKLVAGPVERITELGPGDYASFPADVPHVYEADRHPARALLLSQSPSRRP